MRFGDDHVEAIEVIGYDAAISGENERSTLVPAADGVTMRASWERSDDGRTWRPCMEIRLARVAGEGG